ncbi:unnamed protein product [Trichogramma brassicae]|uniref:Uncharacterized protein n=1 Tax=Trichogramma brassicae TaxID=86971 RepID=A0A6H5J868_9HYME|nr:unnamed protein product [Trichogramma brassicae]
MGIVSSPQLVRAEGPHDEMRNAFIEFVAITKATRKVHTDVCEAILQAYMRESEGLLQVRLREAGAAVYDNGTALVIKGEMSGSYMAAYSGSCGFVGLDEERTELEGRTYFNTPPGNQIVVVAKCTRIMLDDRILEMARSISRRLPEGSDSRRWMQPTISWEQGVPGCDLTNLT